MRRFACLTYVLLASAAVAAPTKPIRKPAPPGLGADQLETFVHAIIADKAGEYDRAASRYRGLETVPAAVYNQADLERRRERYQRALELYRKYLDIAPNAPDRAAVQKLIAQLEQTPMTVVVDGEDLDAVVFIDGKPAGPSPLVTPLADGHHVVDRIGPTSYKHEVITAKPLGYQHVTAHQEEKGNVVLATSSVYGGSWRDGEQTYRMNERFDLPPGRYDTFLFEPGRACSPVSFEVPPDGLVYVFIHAPKDLKRDACTPIKVTAQKIQFPAVTK